MKKILPFLLCSTLLSAAVFAESTNFHDAPDSVLGLKNPNAAGDKNAVEQGAKLFAQNCASCHGSGANGSGNIPSLVTGQAQQAKEGEVFWFIGTGSIANGMPPSKLSESERWQVVSFIKSLPNNPRKKKESVEEAVSLDQSPAPPAPFTDYRFEKPGQMHKILASDLPAPMPESSVGNDPEVVKRPENAWPKVPEGFHVGLYTTGLDNPRLLRIAPNKDIFLAESSSGKIRVFRGITKDGKPKKAAVFATGLNRPYGIAFYPEKNPAWVYVGNMDAIVRFAYKNGDMKARSAPEKIIDLPSDGRGHWTRDIEVSPDGKKLFVAVGSASNVDDPDVSKFEKNRADILTLDLDGKNLAVYAYGIRNAGGGMAFHPESHELWCSVNERDGLGDNLVPDYITHVVPGGFYGWPWWYIGGHQDPRLPGTHPELKQTLLTPDVLLQPHHATLQFAFYTGKQFPEEYRGDIFAAQHGSWNRSVRTGYELIRVPLHHTTKASGEYEDFMTGFVVDGKHVWGRPVGVAVAADGSLLVSDDESNSIWRITHSNNR